MLFSILSPRTCELFEKVHENHPDLWRKTIEKDDESGELTDQLWDTGKAHGMEDERYKAVAAQCDVSYWELAALKTQVFDLIDQEGITPDEAMALCK